MLAGVHGTETLIHAIDRASPATRTYRGYLTFLEFQDSRQVFGCWTGSRELPPSVVDWTQRLGVFHGDAAATG